MWVCVTGAAQTAQMIKTAAQPPHESLAYVEKAINEYARLPDDPKVHAFDLDMERSTMEARAFLSRPSCPSCPLP